MLYSHQQTWLLSRDLEEMLQKITNNKKIEVVYTWLEDGLEPKQEHYVSHVTPNDYFVLAWEWRRNQFLSLATPKEDTTFYVELLEHIKKNLFDKEIFNSLTIIEKSC